MPLQSLPVELLIQIISHSLQDSTKPLSILLVNSTFYGIALQELHQHLRFYTVARLEKFAKADITLSYPPKSIEVQLPGGVFDLNLFVYLREIFSRCRSRKALYWKQLGSDVCPTAIPLSQIFCDVEGLNLRLNSQNGDPNISKLREAFSVVNPKHFSWTGPDPSHHFSNAIVPTAALYLLQAASNWTSLQTLTLTHISFLAFSTLPSSSTLDGSHDGIPFTSLPLPNLRAITLGQVIFLPPWLIALILTSQPSITRFRLIDAYKESIWGRRVRLVDIEAAVASEDLPLLARVSKVVTCESQTERIMGGDRMEDSHA